MRFSILSTITVMAAFAAAAPSNGEGRHQKRKGGECNGTSCKVGFSNFECNKGSCVGDGGGDGAFCTVLDHEDGGRTTYCPVGCPDPKLC